MPEIIGTSKNISGFDPRSIPGCALWLDAADSSSITGTSTVTVWRDKSVSGNNFSTTANTVSTSTDNGYPVLSFANGAIMSSANQITFTTSSAFFIVFHLTTMNGQGLAMVLAFTNIATGSTGDYSIRVSTSGLNGTPVATGNSQDLANANYYVNGSFNPSFPYTTYANSLAMVGTTVPTTSGTSYLQLSSSFSSRYFIGNIAEVLYYPNGLTTIQRQQIEGYLAWKWGLECIPQAPTVPAVLPPNVTSGLALWLDGADPNGNGTIPSNNSTISTWVDKSGNGYNATVASGRIGAQFSSASNCLYFQATNVGYATSYPANPTTETMFVVFNNASPSSLNNIIIGGQLGARSLGAGYSAAVGTNVVGNLKNEVAWLAATPTMTYISGTTVIAVGQYTSSTNSIALNGGLIYSGGAPGFSNATTTYLGVDTTNSSYYYLGYAMEIIFYNSILATPQRQQVESYLATKWGVTLPRENGYTPLLNVPTTIPGCMLWLDPTDTTKITGSVTSIIEKAKGVTLNVSGTVTTTKINNNNALSFGGSGYLSGSMSNLLTGTGFVVFTATAANNGYFPFFTWLDNASGQNNFPAFGYISGGNLIGPYTTFIGAGTPTKSVTIGNTYLATYSWTGTTPAVGFDGVVPTSGTQSAFSSTSSTVWIAYDNGSYTTAAIGEVILYNSVLNINQRQTVERYLSKKWGLSNYYTSIPGSVRGLMLWMDGGDPGTMTFASGSNASGWRDKASQGITLSNCITGQYPTFIPGKGIFFSNPTSLNNTGVVQGFRYDQYWPTLIPTQSMTAFVSFTALCNDTYRSSAFIAENSNGTYVAAPPPSFRVAFENGNNGSSCNRIQWDYNGSAFAQSVGATGNSFLGPRIDTIMSTPGVSSGWMYVNGVEQTYVNTQVYTSPFSNWSPNILYIGGFVGSPQGSRCWMGYFNELLFYSNVLTATERAVVQGYLARKWNNQSIATEVLPIGHPYARINPLSRYFRPTDISTCSLWLDAADASTITGTSPVTLWSDKSGNGYNATAFGTASVSYTAASNAIYFPGSAGLQTSLSTPTNRVGSGFFVIYQMNNTGTNNSGVFQGCTTAYGGRQFRCDSGRSVSTIKENFSVIYSGGPMSYNTLTLVGYVDDGNNIIHSINGTLYAGTSSTVFVSGTNVSLGYSYNTEYMIGNINEVVLFSNTLTTPQRQQVEGYLAWKWGLQGSLPSTHPFYKIPTATPTPFLPTAISGCSLWLDAADPTTLTFSSGSNVATWADKSGNLWSGSSSGNPTLVSGSQNGLPCISFVAGSSQYFNFGNFTPLTSSGITVFAVGKTTFGGSGTFQTFVGKSAAAGQNGRWSLLQENTTIEFLIDANGSGVLATAAASTYSGLFTLFGGGWNGSTTSYLYGNGTQIASAATSGTVVSNSDYLYVGGYQSSTGTGTYPSYFYNGTIGEIVVYNTVLTASQRWQIEGYLSWKWGIQNNLPNSHPYKKSTP